MLRGHKDFKEHKVLRELQEHKVLKDSKDHRDLRVLKVL